jgi:integrase/recombinase XerC
MLLDTNALRVRRRPSIRSHNRHSAITAALEATNGNIAEVMKFSRHKDPKVLMKYDDNRKDVAGDIAGKIDLGRDQN